jgi:hypothetical protein
MKCENSDMMKFLMLILTQMQLNKNAKRNLAETGNVKKN